MLSSSSTAPLLSKDTSKDLTGLPTDEFPGILAKIQSEGRVKTLTRDISKAELKEIYDLTGFTFKKIDKYFGNIAGNALFGAKFEHSNVRMVAQQPDAVAALKNVASQTSAILEVPPKDELLPADTTDKLFKGVAFVAFYGSQEKEGVSCGQKIHKDRFQGPGRLVMRFTEKRLGTSSIIVTGKDGHLRQYIMVGSWLYYAEQKYLHLNHGVPSSEGSSFSLILTINDGADYSTEIVKICTALDTDT